MNPNRGIDDDMDLLFNDVFQEFKNVSTNSFFDSKSGILNGILNVGWGRIVEIDGVIFLVVAIIRGVTDI